MISATTEDLIPEQNLAVVKRILLTENDLYLALKSEYIADRAKPGQFINILKDSFLRRPFGIADVDKENNIIYVGIHKKGKGTEKLFSVKVGEKLGVLGPLGSSYRLQGLKEVFIVAGGTGVYPMLFLTKYCRLLGIKTRVALGFKTQDQSLLLKEFKENCDSLCVAAEDRAIDVKGYAQTALEKLYADWLVHLSEKNSSEKSLSEVHLSEMLIQEKKTGVAVLSCGPIPLMKTAASWAEANDLSCQISMEERMACGIGLCRGCAVELKEEAPDSASKNYQRCCVEGPVFNSTSIVW